MKSFRQLWRQFSDLSERAFSPTANQTIATTQSTAPQKADIFLGIAWLTAFTWLLLGVEAYSCVKAGYTRSELVARGASTKASVVSLDPHNHCTCNYSFDIAGMTYNHSGRCCEKAVGSTIDIIYLPRDPSISGYFGRIELEWEREHPYSFRFKDFIVALVIVAAVPFLFYSLSRQVLKQ